MRHDLNPYSPLRAARWENSPRIEAVAQYLIRAGVNKIIAYAIAYVGVTAVTSWALRALAPMPEFGAVETGLLTNARGATAAQQLVYGEVRKGGTITFIESNGTNDMQIQVAEIRTEVKIQFKEVFARVKRLEAMMIGASASIIAMLFSILRKI